MGNDVTSALKSAPILAPAADGLYYKSPGARHEHKFFVGAHMLGKLEQSLHQWCSWDRGIEGAQEVISLYYDTSSKKFFWDREESVAYRRKVRLRFYRTGELVTYCTLEIKEKHKNLVVKKRVSIPTDTIEKCIRNSFAMEYLLSVIPDSAVKREVEYLHSIFGLVPMAWITYHRASFVGLHDRSLRLTVDSNIRGCEPALFPLKNSTLQIDIFGENRGIFEVKTSASIPLWLSTNARSLELSQSRASKYCAAVKKLYT